MAIVLLFFLFSLTMLQIRLFENLSDLPSSWDQVVVNNIMLSSDFFKVLDESRPLNMTVFAIGFYINDILIGVGMAQYLDVSHLSSFGDKETCFKNVLRDFAFRKFSSGVLFIGNNLLTGEHFFSSNQNISTSELIIGLQQAEKLLIHRLKVNKKKVDIISYKDFRPSSNSPIIDTFFKNYYRFNTQPNMVLSIPLKWKNLELYTDDMSKKYRDQFKRARKKGQEITKRELQFEEIQKHERSIYQLYQQVAKNASFNTFFLHPNHFSSLKKTLKDRFNFFAYFKNDELIGFMTLINNGRILDTYFLGYEASLQKDHQVYLNMLYDMIDFGINHDYSEIVFSRTALEIKSSVGAEPVLVFGYLKHRNPIIQRFLPRLFSYLEPQLDWQQRHPFK